MSHRADYWDEALSLALEGEGLYHLYEQIPQDKRGAIGEALATSAENEGQAFGRDVIPNPLRSEMADRDRSHANEVQRLEREIAVYRDTLARRVGIESHRLYVNCDRVEVSRS